MTDNTLAPPDPVTLADQTLAQLAIALPGATALFRRHKLDFCCGGQISLRDAAAAKGLDLPTLEAALAAFERPDRSTEPMDPAALIDHILSRYHAVHREQLPELIRMARRVEAVHRDHPQVPAGLSALLEQAEHELLDHMAKEEEILFPMMRRGSGGGMAQYPIRVMRQEHHSHGELIAAMMARTQDATPPEGACTTWRALYAGLASLVDDLMQHIHLENNQLFPAFEPSKAAAA
jgi:regulator of cell morphogenesis and NO signaling